MTDNAPAQRPPTKALCIICSNMDAEEVVCDIRNLYDLSSLFPSPNSYRRQGYLHHPNYVSLERSAETCEICNAMVTEIIRFLINDLSPSWASQLPFIQARLKSADSQLILHFPTSRGALGRGITISCRSGFFDGDGKSQDLTKIGYQVSSDYVQDPDSEDETESRRFYPKALVVGKIGMYLARLTDRCRPPTGPARGGKVAPRNGTERC
ncbi:hypothetical protein B0T24DRAFT_931 [Lasiosphaeria ovina]|uniref:Uncharacterized protein n=1 Tax=Lasiosphaeria ovina TaxID=92902 RepID=A0AAE0TWL3_9PEZI|nr:hypothetical protein B0T24DRAFT_931 [Lasiosphaeria ovina]